MPANWFLLVFTAIFLLAAPAHAQVTQVPFGGIEHDRSQPVEITSDTLSVDQNDGSAIFEGNVIVGQGEMRLAAAKVRVEYAGGAATGAPAESDEGSSETTPASEATPSGISRILASGGVTLTTGEEAAEAEEAEYFMDTGKVILTGSVLMTQGRNAVSAERAEIDLESGTANLSGRVRTILQTGNN